MSIMMNATSPQFAGRIEITPSFRSRPQATHVLFDFDGTLVSQELDFSAIHKAYRMAGIDTPRKQIQVVEPYAPFSSTELMCYVMLGFCEHRDVARLCEDGFGEMSGEVPFNPSGGVLCSNPIGATAMVRIVEIALQVMGKAEARQVPNVKIGLATGAGGSSGLGLAQFQTAMVLGVEPN